MRAVTLLCAPRGQAGAASAVDRFLIELPPPPPSPGTYPLPLLLPASVGTHLIRTEPSEDTDVGQPSRVEIYGFAAESLASPAHAIAYARA